MIGNKLIRQFSSKLKQTPKDLPNYDIVIVGANIGGILSRQLEKVLKQRYNVFVVYNNQYNQCAHLDTAFQQGYITEEKYYLDVAKTLPNTVAHSDGVGIQEFLPQENAITLINGRRIAYKQLVISTGLQQDLEQIKGLKSALEDNGHPVFGSYIDSIGKIETAKKPEHYYKFQGGKSFFYIPPFPIQGEGAHYNFFAAFDAWKENQKKLQKETVYEPKEIEFQVINANSTFAEHSSGLNDFIISELNNRGIKYQLNTKVEEIHKNDRRLTFSSDNNEKVTVDYDNFYTIIPTKHHQNLIDAGLGNQESNFLLDVDHKTLQHNQYKNIFGLGDVCNIPTTKSFSASQHQLDVVRNNVFRNLTGQYLNAFYSGFSKVPIYLSKNKLTWFKHHYENRKAAFSLVDSKGGYISLLRYYLYSFANPFWNTLYYTGKVYGPPYQFWLRSYGELEKIPQEQLDSWKQYSEKKSNLYQVERKEEIHVQFSSNLSSIEQAAQQQQQQQKTQKPSEKYAAKQSPVDAPVKRKRGRPKKNPGDVTDYTTE